MEKKEALKIVKKESWRFEDLPTHFKKDKDIVLEAIKTRGLCLKQADKSFKKDKKFILEAAKLNGQVLQYADKSFRKDRNIVLLAVKTWGYALEYAHKSLKKDREIVLTAIKSKSKILKYGDCIKYADESLKKDRNIVLAAVKSNGYALEYVDEIFRKDREVLLKTAESQSYALRFADKSFLEFPNLVEKIFKNEEKISEIDPSKFKFKIVEYKNIQKIKKEKIIWEYSVSKEISRESEFEKTYALDSYNILAALVKEIMFVLKIQKGLGFEVICDKTKTFIENYLFGQKVEFDSEITKANLCSLETRKTIIETMTNEIKKVIIDERSETIISKIFKFSEDKSKRIKNFEKAIYFEPKKKLIYKTLF